MKVGHEKGKYSRPFFVKNVQELIQDILEEEISEFFGRGKSERMRSVDGVLGYRNG